MLMTTTSHSYYFEATQDWQIWTCLIAISATTSLWTCLEFSQPLIRIKTPQLLWYDEFSKEDAILRARMFRLETLQSLNLSWLRVCNSITYLRALLFFYQKTLCSYNCPIRLQPPCQMHIAPKFVKTQLQIASKHICKLHVMLWLLHHIAGDRHRSYLHWHSRIPEQICIMNSVPGGAGSRSCTASRGIDMLGSQQHRLEQ